MIKDNIDEKIKIKEAIIVEGRDDEARVKQSIDAMIIVTHGFGIKEETWTLIDKAYREKGVIIFTDPDHAGEMIRRKIEKRCPKALHANLSREKARKNKDIGVENASSEDILTAILSAKSKKSETQGKSLLANKSQTKNQLENHAENELENQLSNNLQSESSLSPEDIYALGICGGEGAKIRRERLCYKLGIGYTNAKGFIKRANDFGISKKDIMEALLVE